MLLSLQRMLNLMVIFLMGGGNVKKYWETWEQSVNEKDSLHGGQLCDATVGDDIVNI